jgi:hypothetical protein
MRGWTVTVIIILCAAVIMALFHFLFKNHMDKKVNELKAENTTLQQKLAEIDQMETAIEPMARDIPRWKQKVAAYKAAVPTKIDDNVFFRSLRQEMAAAGVSLLSVKLSPGGPWLGDVKEEEAQKLADIGIDVTAARSLKVAFYSVQLAGPYDKTLAVLENLKRHGRMYSIDEVMGPAGTGGGAVMQILDEASTPIQVSGKIFYGIDEDYVSERELSEVFETVVIRPLAGRAQGSIKAVGKGLAREAKEGE